MQNWIWIKRIARQSSPPCKTKRLQPRIWTPKPPRRQFKTCPNIPLNVSVYFCLGAKHMQETYLSRLIVLFSVFNKYQTAHLGEDHDRPGNCPDCIIAAFCSWNRSPNLAELLRYLSTQRSTQPSSLATRDFVVKSLTQSSKQRCMRREYIYRQ